MKKPILVSGSHRSGTTWTGYVLSKAQHVRYAHEPFNIGLPNRESCPIMHWFQLIDSNDLEYSKKIERYIKSYYSPLSFVNIKNTLFKGKYSSPYYFLADIKGRFTDRTVIKDPIAFFSAEWFYKEFKADIVILIRHPAAFIASLKVKNWQFDFNELKKQQNLMDSFPLELKIQIEEFVKSDHNIIDQGILLWNLIHFKIIEYKTIFLDRWYFI